MRIVTRPDFDGVVCAVLLKEALDIREPVKWVEPSALQRGQVDIRPGDIIANLPYHPAGSLWFDHHYTNRIDHAFQGIFRIAPSAAGIIFEQFRDRFARDYSELVAAADKIDSADLTLDEVCHPENYDDVLLSMTVSIGDRNDEPYWNTLVTLLADGDIKKTMADPVVKQRCEDVVRQNEAYARHLKKNTHLEQKVSITDFRHLQEAPAGNRFLVYALFPESCVNLKIRYEDGNSRRIVVNVGHSIFNRDCRVNAGMLLSRFGGGGHYGAASARFDACNADEYIPQIIDSLVKNEEIENL